MKKQLHTLLLLVLFPMAVFSQNIHVSGTVTQNGETVANTYVAIMHASFTDTIGVAWTNDVGFYEMDIETNPGIDSMVVWISSGACPEIIDGTAIFAPSSELNFDCGDGTQNSTLYIGGTSTSEDNLSWYFINNFMSGVASYSWNIEDQQYNTYDVSHTFSQPGNYAVDLIVELTDGTLDTAQFMVHTGTNPAGGSGNCQALFFPMTDSIEDGSVYFVNSSLGDNLTYLWDFGDGSTSAEAYPTHIFADDEATYNVCLTISGDDCDQQFCAEVSGGLDGSGLITNNTKNPRSGLSKSGTFEFVVVPVQSGSTGLDDENTPVKMSVFPNPSSGTISLQLNLPSVESGVLNISDITGKIVMQKTIHNTGKGNLVTLDLESLSDGTYLIQYQGSRISEVQKVVLQ